MQKGKYGREDVDSVIMGVLPRVSFVAPTVKNVSSFNGKVILRLNTVKCKELQNKSL